MLNHPHDNGPEVLKRLQVDLTESEMLLFDKMMKQAGCRTRCEFLRKCTRLMTEHLVQEGKGGTPGYLSKDGEFNKIILL